MSKKQIGLAVISVIIILVIIASFFANSFVEKKAISLLEKEVPELKFETLDINIFQNEASLTQIDFNKPTINLKSDELTVSGLNYWKILFGKNIKLNKLEIQSPQIVYNSKNKTSKSADKSDSKSKKFNKDITVDKIQIKEGSFEILDSISKSKLIVKSFDFKIENIHADSTTIKNKIPFEFGQFGLEVDSVTYNLDKRQQLDVAKINIQNKKTLLESLHLTSKYSRQEFQKYTPIEKDMYELTIDSLGFENTDYGFRNDSLKILIGNAFISNANFDIYRDKTLPDDTSIKPMYSEMLRKMSLLLKMDTLKISNSKIVYEEKMKADREPGKVIFANLNATIANLTNFSDQKEFPTTSVSANADFMNEAPLNLQWGFKVNNPSDFFNVSGNMGVLSAKSMNGFLKPGMNVKAEGSITSMRYDFSGNRFKATGGVNIAYKDFKIEVLKNDGTEKSGFLTTVANVFVNHNGESGENANKGLEIERDKTKSFWNYLWLCIRKGALKTFI
ncbi:hypothetical protein [Zunongwangia endophytica]|uniref:Uncharacterized protein n=1 Tax=Zunongwangia endophytica TaxID=1808945 RepID=A0ABV8HC61_9FLAO|nr:hypothetical protein [Zunongwangia endophytica]MDN3596257.1 hypothetical protein [Zunongwangia endophytica]